MRGRKCACLLSAAFVVLSATVALGQTNGARAQQIRAGQATPEQVARERGTVERVTSDQVAADFVRSLATAVLPGEAERGLRILPFRPVPPIARWGTIGFPQMARVAGIIFSGSVTRIVRRPATRGQAIETIAITFHVERAIRGAKPGEEFTIFQWIGLWSSGQRYRVGERVLLFLYPPSKLGLTSCVAAPMGRFGIDPAGRVLLTTQHLAAFRTDPVLGGKSRARLSDFALAVRRASEAE